MKKNLPKFFDRLKFVHNRDFSANFRESLYLQYLHEISASNMGELLEAVKKEFHDVAFVGNNPEVFLNNMAWSKKIGRE